MGNDPSSAPHHEDTKARRRNARVLCVFVSLWLALSQSRIR